MISTDTPEIVEVSPRDGIQNEAVVLSTATKLDLISRLCNTGLARFEATSFVDGSRVPQMADAEDVIAGLDDDQRECALGLVLNPKGMDRALTSGVGGINCVVVATDTFGLRNQGRDVAAMVADWHAMSSSTNAGSASMNGRAPRLSLTIAAAFGCPFEGEVSVSRLMEVVEKACTANPDELALADTIGVASPADVRERVRAVRGAFPDMKLRLHLHNTRGTGLANAWVGLEEGVTALDSSLGGTGGCPFAPRATGNIATEDLIYMLERAGISTGVDLDACIEAALWLERQLDTRAPGQVMRAGPFPPAPPSPTGQGHAA